jgi:phage internal scaffolding protein
MFRTAYGEKKKVVSKPVGESMTKQSFKKECDINNILAKYRKTGMIDHIRENNGQYVDVPESFDYHGAMNIVAKASSMFEELPSDLRKKFDNDAGAFLDFVNNPENADAMRDLGLMKPAEQPVLSEADQGVSPSQPDAEVPADKGANAPASA